MDGSSAAEKHSHAADRTTPATAQSVDASPSSRNGRGQLSGRGNEPSRHTHARHPRQLFDETIPLARTDWIGEIDGLRHRKPADCS